MRVSVRSLRWGVPAILAVSALATTTPGPLTRASLTAAYRAYRDPSLVEPRAPLPAPPPPAPAEPARAPRVPESDVDLALDGAAPDDLDDPDSPTAAALTLPDLRVPVTRRTLRYVRYFARTEGGRKIFQACYRRSTRTRDLVEDALRAAELPLDLAWLPAIESGFDPHALSPAGALGLWQLMPDTARAYGLTRTTWIDERLDPARSTRAAVKHLADLHRRFKRWDLALAAYNAGSGRVQSALDRAERASGGKPITFTDLAAQGLLPDETAAYVPQVVAFALVAINAEAFDLSLPDAEPTPEPGFLIVPEGTLLDTIARAADITPDDLRLHNPSLLGDRVPPRGGAQRVALPRDRVEQARRALPAYRDQEIVLGEERDEDEGIDGGVAALDEPGSGEPAFAVAGAEPGSVQPGSVQPGSVQPGSVQPGSVQPGSVQPGSVQPGSVQPGSVQPGSVQPGLVQPGTPAPQPGLVQPGSVQPGSVQPGTPAPQPGSVQPGSVQPGSVQPGSVQPGTPAPQPGSVQPGSVQPGTPAPRLTPPGLQLVAAPLGAPPLPAPPPLAAAPAPAPPAPPELPARPDPDATPVAPADPMRVLELPNGIIIRARRDADVANVSLTTRLANLGDNPAETTGTLLVGARDLEAGMELCAARLRASLADTLGPDVADLRRRAGAARRQLLERAPYGRAWLALGDALFPPRHPLAGTILGATAEPAALRDLLVADLLVRERAAARPSLTVTGDIDEAYVHRLATALLGALPPRGAAPKPPPAPDRVFLEALVPEPRALYGWVIDALDPEGEAALRAAHALLAGPKTALLRRALVDDAALSLGVDLGLEQLTPRTWVVTIEASIAPAHTINDLERALDDTLSRVALETLDPADLRAALTEARERLDEEIAAASAVHGPADGPSSALAASLRRALDPARPAAVRAKLDALTAASLGLTFRRHLTAAQRKVIITSPARHGADHRVAARRARDGDG